MRLFIAVNFPTELRARWVTETASLRSTAPEVRWVPPAQMHVTVAFLGEQPDALVEQLRSALDAIAKPRSRLSLEVQGVGAFPNWRRPRVVWLGVIQDPALMTLAEAVARDCRAWGIPGEARPFHPHVTLARIDSRASTRHVRQLEQAARAVTTRSVVDVHSIDLMVSMLGPGGAKHDVLHRALLGSP